MGEITDALRRAKLSEEKQDIFRDSAPGDRENPTRARDWGGPEIDASEEDFPYPDPPESDPVLEQRQTVNIPRDMDEFWIPRAVLVEPPVRAAECFRHFAVQVNRELERRGDNSVLVTSALPEEGKTTISCNLALAIASISGGRRTALVDLDLHRSSVSRAMRIVPEVGFERVLSGDVSLEEARVPTDLPGFDLYPIATPLYHTTKKAYELLAGPHLETALSLLSKRYDRVVFDGPPALLVPDVALVADHVPTFLIVTRKGVTRRSSYLELLSLIPREKLLGTFLNEESSFGRPHYAYYYEEPEAAS